MPDSKDRENYKSKPDSSRWMELVDQAVRYKEDYSDWKSWKTYREYYRNNFKPLTEGQPYLPYNITFALARTVIPNIYFRNPYIMVSPRMGIRGDPGADIHAKVVESVVNWLVQEMSLKKTLKTMVLDTFLCGRGVAKIGYDSEFGYAINETLAGAGVEDATITSISRDGKEKIEYNSNIKPGMPWVGRVDPDMWLVPFGARELDDCEWLDHIVLRPVRDVRLDPKYSGVRDLKGTHLETSIHFQNKQRFHEQLAEQIDIAELHEICDMKRRERLVIAPTSQGESKIIRGPIDDVLQIDGAPYVDLMFNEDPEYYWATPDAKIVEPQQLEMNEARTQAMMHRRVALLKVIVERGVLKPEEVSKLVSGKVMPIVFADATGISNRVHTIQPSVPHDLAQWPEIIRGDVRELMGLGRQQMGEADSSSRRTATESQIVQMAKEIRMDEKRDGMADLLQVLMRKVMQVVFKFWTKERVAQVVGFDGALYWVKYNADSLKGEYDLKVDVESMTPQTKRLRREDLMQIIQGLSNNPRANIDYLMQALLREFDWLDLNRVLPQAQETQGGPMSQQEFAGQQQGLMNNPQQLQQRLTSNVQSGMPRLEA
ncbi:hypothetical protein CMI37_01085 [Candidatus Pacearchaeota archaeon]|nr:hypothetical protein [Candidatus Pacearchaeota archaeon]